MISAPMVETFVVESDSFKSWGQHRDLTAASLALPEGSYTTLRTYGTERVLRLEQHVERLRQSLPRRPALEAALVRRALASALERTAHAESRVRLTFAPPRLFVTVAALVPLAPEVYSAGARCVTIRGVQRENPHAKSTGFISTAARGQDALPAGVAEALMLADDGSILEGLSSNFFAISNGILRTEDARVLRGVTRAVVLEVAELLLPVVLQPVREAELAAVGECFLTSVSREILPVVEIDGRSVADGKPGPTTRTLMRRFAALVERETRSVRA
jgi:branched-subunit amino acid aminotransferase/4-amino-4-deoxychorismate lyase